MLTMGDKVKLKDGRYGYFKHRDGEYIRVSIVNGLQIGFDELMLESKVEQIIPISYERRLHYINLFTRGYII